MARNLSGERAAVEEPLQEPQGRENCSSLISNSLADIEGSLQRDAEAAYVHTEVRPPGTSPALPSPCPQRHAVRLGIEAARHRVIFSLPAQQSPAPACCSRHGPAAAGTWEAAGPGCSPRLPLLLFQVGVLGKTDVIAGLAGSRWEAFD